MPNLGTKKTVDLSKGKGMFYVVDLLYQYEKERLFFLLLSLAPNNCSFEGFFFDFLTFFDLETEECAWAE